MGNQIKGTFPFTVDDDVYVMQFTANGMCALEDETGESAMAFLNRMNANAESNLAFKDVRLLFWAGLVEHHEGLTLHQAGRIITKLGGLAAAMELAGKAVQASLPQPEGKADQSSGKAKATS